jgi:hypothetical protein
MIKQVYTYQVTCEGCEKMVYVTTTQKISSMDGRLDKEDLPNGWGYFKWNWESSCHGGSTQYSLLCSPCLEKKKKEKEEGRERQREYYARTSWGI